MSTAVGAASTTKNVVPFKANLDEEITNKVGNGGESDQLPYSDDEEETDEAEEEEDPKLESDKEMDPHPGPQFSLKEHIDKDKDDESLRKWKEQLLGSVDMSAVGGRPDQILPIPFTNDPKKSVFTLKEGTKFRLKFNFIVSNNIVSGLKYNNVVWKTGVRVDNIKKMLGTYSPQQEPYIYELEEETTPSGFFARGTYSARTKFVDDDKKCYLDASYQFEIQKNWPTPH
ncbi:Rab GDP dissociation inhibitor alpha [Stylosanthes scabra]|uniref:Rab GDP dissociation inhibitor alpha n=1 Tax=Stylosanthes scabra TaxID=79078 RepID=A0ABU6U9W6_9FABA|nr:Rab GDP dissociation inhibitor alpha [Stylosanthes scabra]